MVEIQVKLKLKIKSIKWKAINSLKGKKRNIFNRKHTKFISISIKYTRLFKICLSKKDFNVQYFKFRKR